MLKRPLVALVAAGLLASVAVSTVSAGDPFTVVADGLHNPRGLAFAPNGRLYVAEAGLGDGTGTGFGMTGSVSEIRHAWSSSPTVRTVIGGLASAGDDHGVIGPDGISIHGRGNIDVLIGLSQAGTGIPSSQIGALLKVTPSGRMRILANVGDFDYAWSTQHQDLAPNDFVPGDSNPYGVLAVHGGAYIVDAGTNTLDWVGRDGKIKILAYFPNGATHDTTPTCVVKGPDGALYVGTLSLIDSLPFFEGGATPPSPQAMIFRVDPKAADPSSLSTVLSVATVWATGFWPINGCAADHKAIYVSELAIPTGPDAPLVGDVIRVPFSDPTQHQSLTGGALSFPGGVAIGPDHHVYVSNMTTSSAGQVVRLN
jgi:hypothetical protein